LVPLWAWAQAPGPAPTPGPAGAPTPDATKPAEAATPAEPPTEAEKTLDAAIAKVAALKSVAADLEQTADMLGQHFVLKGQYFRAPNHRVYLKLTLSGLGDTTGIMLQVCDGQTLWDYQQILKSQYYSKFDVDKIF